VTVWYEYTNLLQRSQERWGLSVYHKSNFLCTFSFKKPPLNSFVSVCFCLFLGHKQSHNTASWHELLIISISSRPRSIEHCLWDMWGDNNVWCTQQQLSSSLLSTVSITDPLSPLLSVFPPVQLSPSQPSCPLPSLAVLHRLLRQGHFQNTKDSTQVLFCTLFLVDMFLTS